MNHAEKAMVKLLEVSTRYQCAKMTDKEQSEHFMQCRLGDCCSTCKTFIEGFKK